MRWWWRERWLEAIGRGTDVSVDPAGVVARAEVGVAMVEGGAVEPLEGGVG